MMVSNNFFHFLIITNILYNIFSPLVYILTSTEELKFISFSFLAHLANNLGR